MSFHRTWPIVLAMAATLAGAAVGPLHGQEPVADASAAGDEDVRQVQSRLAERYDRLELSVARLAELSRSTQPRRAELLRQLISQSRDRDIAGQFDNVVASLEQQSYSSAIDSQADLEGELQQLLELLLQEDRDRQLDSERKRISRFLQDVNRLIRRERGVAARTEGGDDAQRVAEDQQEIAGDTKQVGDELEVLNETKEQRTQRERQAEQSPKEGTKPQSDSSPDSKPSDSSKESPGDPQKPSESKPSDSQSKPGESEPGESKPSEGSPSPEAPDTPESPAQRAAQRLKQAQQRMEEASKQLEQAQREGASQEQRKALEELEQAKAELERILRQLREEELERMLVMLEARLRKMLDQQVEIHTSTKQLDASVGKAAEHEIEIASGRLARQEGLIVREADRALLLLREDGTSTAFPEAIEQARDDMQSIADRLRDSQVDRITQGLEEDVIAALEESLAAMQQALKKLRDQKGQPPQQGEGAPGEKPLVDQLAELRMIRSLQARVNRRTQLYGDMIEGEQALAKDLLQSLRELGIRQQKIFQATQELETEEK